MEIDGDQIDHCFGNLILDILFWDQMSKFEPPYAAEVEENLFAVGEAKVFNFYLF